MERGSIPVEDLEATLGEELARLESEIYNPTSTEKLGGLITTSKATEVLTIADLIEKRSGIKLNIGMERWQTKSSSSEPPETTSQEP